MALNLPLLTPAIALSDVPKMFGYNRQLKIATIYISISKEQEEGTEEYFMTA
jgi:hypothetical protein